MSSTDVNIVGSGPNGLAAAVTLARQGLAVRVFEKGTSLGGGMRTAELTLPGFRHDVCSAVHPQALASPFFQDFGITKRVPFIIPEVSYVHPIDAERAGVAYRDLDRTIEGLGRDGASWQKLFGPLLKRLDGVLELTGGPLLRVPNDIRGAMQFGLRAVTQSSVLAERAFHDDVAPALLSGVMAHASARIPSLAAAGVGLTLGTQGHAAGWGLPAGGSQAIADALAEDFVAHGGEIVLEHEVTSLPELAPATATLLDISPANFERISDGALPHAYSRKIARFRPGNGVFKVDFALSAPVPWANPATGLSPTVHLGGTRSEIARSENTVRVGQHAENPFVLVSQPSLFDTTRAPTGKHVLWAYIHVPAGSTSDQTETIISQIERYAPGFRDVILAAVAMSPADLEDYNPNYIGGDISGGEITMQQLLKRPVLSRTPWRTPLEGVYLCSASTPPGPAVHGMCGWFAARQALEDIWHITL